MKLDMYSWLLVMAQKIMGTAEVNPGRK